MFSLIEECWFTFNLSAADKTFSFINSSIDLLMKKFLHSGLKSEKTCPQKM